MAWAIVFRGDGRLSIWPKHMSSRPRSFVASFRPALSYLKSSASGSNREALSIAALKFEAEARSGQFRRDHASNRSGRARHQHVLDPLMIEEVFDMAQVRDRTAKRSMHRGHTVRGERNVICLAESRDLKEAGHTGAARDICLQDVHSTPLQHGVKIIEIVAVFAGRDVHAPRRALAQKSQPCEVVRRDGL